MIAEHISASPSTAKCSERINHQIIIRGQQRRNLQRQTKTAQSGEVLSETSATSHTDNFCGTNHPTPRTIERGLRRHDTMKTAETNWVSLYLDRKNALCVASDISTSSSEDEDEECWSVFDEEYDEDETNADESSADGPYLEVKSADEWTIVSEITLHSAFLADYECVSKIDFEIDEDEFEVDENECEAFSCGDSG